MTLKLDALLKKAKDKGYDASKPSVISIPSNMLKTWQQESVLYSGKTENDLNTNRTQTEHKPNTNRTQTTHKLNTNRTQTEHRKNTNRTQTEHKLNTQLNTNKLQIRPITSFATLVGLQRQTLVFLFQNCKLIGSRCTQELTTQHISESLKIPIGSIKTTLFRLEDKQFIKRDAFKNGRGGWSRYEIKNEVYREISGHYIELKLDENRTQTEHKLNTQPNTNSPLSSSSYLNINSTTTTSDQLSQEFENINFDCLDTIGFTKNHLSQIATRSGLSPEIIQDSIDAFAFDLKRNNKAAHFKKRPLDVFMGLLTKGGMYLPPENYETPQQESMRLYIEKKKADLEKENKLQHEALSIAFEQWKMDGQNQKTIEAVIDGIEDPMLKKIKSVVDGRVVGYYEKNIWPSEKKQFFKDL